MEKKKLIGYHSFTSKAGDSFMVIDVVSKVTSREAASGYVGDKVESIFVPDTCWNKLTKDIVGKTIICTFEVSNGRAYLVDFEVEK